jgi:membrane protein DedA with SNARE-associated domain
VQEIVDYLAQYGLALVFALVFVEQIGVPIPALPFLIVAGALSARGDMSAPLVLAVALAASLLADSVWFALGRRHGRRILATLCSISLSPDACVRQTESIYTRWGMGALVASKFITGFSTVAPPLAGAMGARVATFLLYDALGILAWAGLGLGLGYAFHRQVEGLIALLDRFGSASLVLVAGALAAFVLVKWWQRKRFYRALRTARITVDELRGLMQREPPPVIVDVRTDLSRRFDPRRIPGATTLELREIQERLAGIPTDREIVLYCT